MITSKNRKHVSIDALKNHALKHAISVEESKSQYDHYAKKILSVKIILAHILIESIEEFKDMKPEVVAGLIEGEPKISENAGISSTEKIQGLNSEDFEPGISGIRYDIIFYVQMSDGLSKMIINVEAQRKQPTKYRLLNRGIFYTCCMVSSQKDRFFANENYDDINKVYSIWLCFNMNEDSMTHYHLTSEDVIGHEEWKGYVDLLNLVMIGLRDNLSKKEEGHGLHRLLGTIFLPSVTKQEKFQILENEYGISFGNEEREDDNTMCNLSDMVYEYGMEKGMEKGMKSGLEVGGAKSLIELCQELSWSKEEIIEKLKTKLDIDANKAEEYYMKYASF